LTEHQPSLPRDGPRRPHPLRRPQRATPRSPIRRVHPDPRDTVVVRLSLRLPLTLSVSFRDRILVQD
jgi:hypothetical protein